MTRVLIMLLSLLLFSGQTLAETEHAAMALVKDTTSKIIAKLKAEKEEVKKNPERITELVDEIVLPHFDFTRMSAWTLGKNWKKASKDQQTRFVKEFKMLLVRTYAKALADNVDQEIVYLKVQENTKNPKEVKVFTEVRPQAGLPIPITYRMHDIGGGKWKVFDVDIDQVSLVANYRGSFAKQIRKSGIDDLIASLATKNQK